MSTSCTLAGLVSVGLKVNLMVLHYVWHYTIRIKVIAAHVFNGLLNRLCSRMKWLNKTSSRQNTLHHIKQESLLNCNEIGEAGCLVYLLVKIHFKIFIIRYYFWSQDEYCKKLWNQLLIFKHIKYSHCYMLNKKMSFTNIIYLITKVFNELCHFPDTHEFIQL